jgi:hypothetical protein
MVKVESGTLVNKGENSRPIGNFPRKGESAVCRPSRALFYQSLPQRGVARLQPCRFKERQQSPPIQTRFGIFGFRVGRSASAVRIGNEGTQG